MSGSSGSRPDGSEARTLRAVSQLDLEVVEERDGSQRLREPTPPAAMIAQHAPVLEPGDRMFDACATAPVEAPCSVAHDAPAVAPRQNGHEREPTCLVIESTTRLNYETALSARSRRFDEA